MGKKMKLPSLFNNKETATKHARQWNWPSCNHPTTHSFREAAGDNIFRTMNSVFFFDNVDAGKEAKTPPYFSVQSREEESLEMIIHEAHLEKRLFFEPRGGTSSILEKAAAAAKPDRSQQQSPLRWLLGET